MHRSGVALASLLSALAVAGCGRSSSAAWNLSTTLGAYDDGSGRLGIAILQTLRANTSQGAGGPWTVTLRHESGVTVSYAYDAPGSSSYEATWRLDSAPLAGHWEIEAVSGGEVVRSSADLGNGSSLAPPVVSLSPDGGVLEWTAVAGAAAYVCRVYASGVLQLEAASGATSCDLSALPPGAYHASVLALSYDPSALALDTAAAPVLPRRFDVSEARIGLSRPSGTGPARALRAVGGAYDNGVGPRSLTVWLSLLGAEGAVVSSDWRVEIVGPGLPAVAPMTFAYRTGYPRIMVWAVGMGAAIGTYTATATSGAETAVAQFTVGAPAWLPMPTGVIAMDGAQGAATARWDAVAGGVNYLASAYDAATGELVASQWTPATETDFAAGTFAAGRRYDVYVAVADVDMVGGVAPTQVSVAENVFDFATFVAR